MIVLHNIGIVPIVKDLYDITVNSVSRNEGNIIARLQQIYR